MVSIPDWADLPEGATEEDAVSMLGMTAYDPHLWACPVSIGASESAAASAIRYELGRRQREGRLW